MSLAAFLTFVALAGDAPAPLAPLPTARQLARQEMELCAFVHFGMNTFTDREWGLGNEDPKLFAPSDLDCRQWARVFKDAGIQGVILTCKHHDGFCLWPSQYTSHSVKRSPWKDGKGDVVRELSDACRELGLKFGIYLSPWDRNSPLYGDSEKYDEYYVNQLTELLTNYGDIFEVWWDGACGEGPNGKRQIYDWKRYTEIVRKLQPSAVIFSDAGPDIRWVGNENGFAGETCWSMFTNAGIAPGTPGIENILNAGQIDGRNWIPPECDVSIRPGWFHHAREDADVKSLERLIAIHTGSVGRNGSLLLNVPADKRGRIADVDANRLNELGRTLERMSLDDVARAKPAEADRTRNDAAFAPAKAFDGDPTTYWAPDDDARSATLTVNDLGGKRRIDRVVLREPIALGQRVKSFRVEGFNGTNWIELAAGTTIGRKRILAISPIQCERLRLVVTDARACPLIASFEAYAQPPNVRFVSSQRDFIEITFVELASDISGAAIFYTLDGTPPTERSTRYRAPIKLTTTTTVSAIAFANGGQSFTPAIATFRAWTPADLRPPDDPLRETVPGVRWRAFERDVASVSELSSLEPATTGHTHGIDLDVRTRKEHCAIVFDGWIDAPKDGIYSFWLASDDGSRLFVSGVEVIDNDGLHGRRELTAQVGLRTGLHAFRLEWFNSSGDAVLELDWSGPNIARQRVPPSVLKR